MARTTRTRAGQSIDKSPSPRSFQHLAAVTRGADGCAQTAGTGDLIRLLTGEQIGRTIEIEVLRDGTRIRLRLTLEERQRRAA
jgi:S1-C subfamily serine protease